MHLLAFDTSTDRMSVAVGAVRNGAPQVWSHNGAGGSQASASLIPTIRALMAQAGLEFADLDAIVFGRGPGAFTGLRTACAVAQGLAFGARGVSGGAPLPVLPLDTLLVLAEQARFAHAPQQAPWSVLAMLDARMNEIYRGGYRWDGAAWHTELAPALARPQDLHAEAGQAMAGNVFEVYGEHLPAEPDQVQITALPNAIAMLRLAPVLLASGQGVDPALALPMYIRDKVASTSSERAAAKAAAANPP